ncbi:MAG: sulfite exporter TauE/SafE family protein [Thermovirgaceae bacterium]|nr:sulfite exporter TauE/SafE family protein [Thermovirgaceae bacterium]
MGGKDVLIRLHLRGMTCSGCERIVENTLREIPGVLNAKANYGGGFVDVVHDGTLSPETLSRAVEEAGDYSTAAKGKNTSGDPAAFIPVGLAVMLFLVLRYFGVDPALVPTISASAGLGLLFIIGLTTSLHCVGMCGGIQIAQCTGDPGEGRSLIPSILYNAGRVVSYTLLGGLIGMAGSVLSFSPRVQGSIMLAAAIFMALMGLNALLPDLVRVRFGLPSGLAVLRKRLSKGRGSFVIGLLNGLMPCGPLQAMQLYALGTGSFLAGASAMFAFSLGTVPLMFSLGAVSSLLTVKYRRIMRAAGGGLVVVLALFMAQNGLALAGFSGSLNSVSRSGAAEFAASGSSAAELPPVSSPAAVANTVAVEQVVVVNVTSRGYASVRAVAGVPIRLIFRAGPGAINGCNNAIVIPSLQLKLSLKQGDTEAPVFTPEKAGIINYSCWMGMIPGRIEIVERDTVPDNTLEQAETPAPGISGEQTAPAYQASCCGS